jgi:hypothetical protein
MLGVPHYAKQPRKAISVYEVYGKKAEEPIKKVRFEAVVPPKKKRKTK